ncbi:MAG: LacI family DNA-binding transcriptional regulator [Curvibacter sp.]|nr:LacI family DNA-binding transcriptional regulator [Curvibacter sp.]
MNQPSTRSRRATGRATLADVARLAEVSPMTASRALRADASVDPLLAERVRQAATKLGYVPDPAARALASQRSSHIAVLIPSITNRLFVELLEAVQQVLREGGYQTLIGISHYRPLEEEVLVREHLLHRPAGMLLTGLEQTPLTRQLLQASRVPVVSMMDLADEGEGCSVGFSQWAAAAAMTRHLLDRGRRRIAFVGAQLDARAMQRLQGWRDTLVQAGLYDPGLQWLDEQASTVALGGSLFERILAAEPQVDAIFFCNDDLAQGALLRALRLGIDVPGRVAVAGFNDLPESAEMVPPLSTVRTHRAAIGERAAQMLLALLRQEQPGARRVDLGFELMVRQST